MIELESIILVLLVCENIICAREARLPRKNPSSTTGPLLLWPAMDPFCCFGPNNA